MSSAVSKTKSLIRKDLPVDWVIPNENNPNKMSVKSFDMLCNNIEENGFTDSILVKKIGKKKYRVVGGHHRLEAAKYLEFKKVPCTIITDPNFDEEMETFQLVRHNMIKGKLDQESFFKLYEKFKDKYDDSAIIELFGFSDEEEFAKLIKQTAKQLPKEMQKEFKEAAAELKTIDELSALLNKMFTNYGDTLDYSYMIVDYGGKKSVWLRTKPKTIKALDVIGEICKKESRTMDDIVGGVLQLIANGKLNKTLKKIIKSTPEVAIDKKMLTNPTMDNIDNHNGVK